MCTTILLQLCCTCKQKHAASEIPEQNKNLAIANRLHINGTKKHSPISPVAVFIITQDHTQWYYSITTTRTLIGRLKSEKASDLV